MIECASGVVDALAYVLSSDETILFDIDAPEDLSPAFLAVTNCLAARLRSQNVSFDTRRSPGMMSIMDNIRVGLTGQHGPRIIQSSEDPGSGRVFYARFQNAESERIQGFVDSFSPLLAGLPNLYEEMESTLAELMDNVFAHSESQEGGYLAGRHYADQNLLRFAVCDLGISIPRHLRKMEPTYVNKPDVEVLADAFVLGVSGDKTVRFGSGLPTVSDMTAQLGGHLFAYSGSAVYEVRAASSGSRAVQQRFPGTLISIEWPTTGGE